MTSLRHYPGLFLLTLLPLVSLQLYSGDTDFRETSGDELKSKAHAPDYIWHSMARRLREDIKRVHGEQIKRDFPDQSLLTTFPDMDMDMEMPVLSSSDACLPNHFKTQKCLQRIYSGLKRYQAYLPYVESENLNEALLVDIKERTSRLLSLIKGKGKINDDKAYQTSLKEALIDSAWKRKQFLHSVLSKFTEFMADTSRAINYMKLMR